MSPATVARLVAAGHDVEWAGTWPRDPGDVEVLAAAHRSSRVLVSTDRGFGELSVIWRRPHSGIIVIRDTPAITHAQEVLRVIELHAEDLLKGAIVIVKKKRLRIRWPPTDA